ncbi:hypothetical protein [Mycetocola reblochoni]|uniref:Uncharacterized protein n=2 Tax=Mycetocola reblochoni TaxID=331618 RepID=A0A1R4IUN8_9MICO|nr:hypothetical protein [Mycetocola reblochoni]RLP71016.1 hypothetical protein D9V30_00900 [Mycetocola reblochoni]SJN23597.1 hypothetical protein FM119_03715 [Mycetocola reblochoni REB411]
MPDQSSDMPASGFDPRYAAEFQPGFAGRSAGEHPEPLTAEALTAEAVAERPVGAAPGDGTPASGATRRPLRVTSSRAASPTASEPGPVRSNRVAPDSGIVPAALATGETPRAEESRSAPGRFPRETARHGADSRHDPLPSPQEGAVPARRRLWSRNAWLVLLTILGAVLLVIGLWAQYTAAASTTMLYGGYSEGIDENDLQTQLLLLQLSWALAPVCIVLGGATVIAVLFVLALSAARRPPRDGDAGAPRTRRDEADRTPESSSETVA